MSFRDLRNFVEHLRILGYPSLISIESFRNPNFPLVGNILVWLAKRFDQDVNIPLETETENERVTLIRNIAQFMAVKANIKLNTKRLYQADGFAVKELIKITNLLCEALKVIKIEKTRNEDDDDFNFSTREFDISDKLHDLKHSRQLATEITSTGATLFDLLGKEIDLRGLRQRSIGRQFEVGEVEEDIIKAIEAIKSEISETKHLIENVSANEASLDSKIERRKMEIDRYEKRLQTLKKVRPAFLEEFQQLEGELDKLFQQYCVRVRCLNQLEQMVSESERAHLEKQQLQAASQKIVKTIPLEPNDSQELISFEANVLEPRQAPITRQERPRARTGGRNRNERNPKAFVELDQHSPSGSSLDLSSDSEDELFLDKDEPELLHSDEDDSFGIELSAMDRIERTAPSGRKTSSKIQDNSDDDF